MNKSLVLAVFVAFLATFHLRDLPAQQPPPDTVELRGGGQVAGKVRQKADTPNGRDVKGYVTIQVDDGISIAIDRAQVTRVRTADELAEYKRRANAAGDDPEKHYQLGRWCTKNHLSQHRLHHYHRAITLNPEHSEARAALDYVRDDLGNWIPYAVQQRNRGLVRANGGWRFPEAVAQENAAKAAKVKASQFIKEIAKLRKQYLGRGKNPQEAFAQLQAIQDPLASVAVAGEFEKSRGNTSQPRALRLLWVKLLGSFRTPASVRALVFAGLNEPDATVKESAIQELKKYGGDSAIATYVPMLNPKTNSISNIRSGLRGLTYFPDPALAMTYVDALVTIKMEVKPPGPGVSAGFDNTGGGSFSTGSDTKPVPVPYKNTDALTLLKMVEPDVDYGFNQQAWREHFAQKLTAYRGDLRRDR